VTRRGPGQQRRSGFIRQATVYDGHSLGRAQRRRRRIAIGYCGGGRGGSACVRRFWSGADALARRGRPWSSSRHVRLPGA
jgi:hypothetical protein